jgi:hypothetical protein
MSFWQLLALATLFVGVILAAATIYIKIKEKKRTENRFNVVALWSCATLAASVMDETILLVCCTDESEIKTERLESQIHFERSRHRLTRLIVVVERPGSKLKVGQCLSKFAGQCDV